MKKGYWDLLIFPVCSNGFLYRRQPVACGITAAVDRLREPDGLSVETGLSTGYPCWRKRGTFAQLRVAAPSRMPPGARR